MNIPNDLPAGCRICKTKKDLPIGIFALTPLDFWFVSDPPALYKVVASYGWQTGYIFVKDYGCPDIDDWSSELEIYT